MVTGKVGAYDLVKVLDFGLVKSLARADGGDGSVSNVGHLTGTPLYMSPEIISHPEAAEPRSDLYAVAALAYYMLTGHHVFEGETQVELLAAHLHKEPIPPSARAGRLVPPDLEALVMRGLSKSPADRPPSAAAFRDALMRCRVSPWTQEDARAWWRTRGARALRREDRPAKGPEYPPTVTVVSQRAMHG
jgi:serine/threonine-protein kinase